MVTKEVAEAAGGLKALIPSGTSVLVEGELTETPPGTKQVVSQAIQSHPSLRPDKDAVCVAETGTPVGGLVPLYITAGQVSPASLASKGGLRGIVPRQHGSNAELTIIQARRAEGC